VSSPCKGKKRESEFRPTGGTASREKKKAKKETRHIPALEVIFFYSRFFVHGWPDTVPPDAMATAKIKTFYC